MEVDQKNLVIGFDVGTSSLKLIVLNCSTNSVEFELTKSTNEARLINKQEPRKNEQNVSVLLDLVKATFAQIPAAMWIRIKAIQLCGQMHGVVLWNTLNERTHSNLVTWQDARCDSEFLASLPVKSRSDLNSGFGCATLFWYGLTNKPISDNDSLNQYNSSGTIQDYITYLLTGNSSMVAMSDHNALSWGYFDIPSMKWQSELYDCKQFPSNVLPHVVKPGSIVGKSCNIFLNEDNLLLNKAKICVALGDLQCSVYSCLENESDCVINISTSSQICMAIDQLRYNEVKAELPKSISVFPYFEDKVLLVAASLNGGNVLEKFVETILTWNSELNLLNENRMSEERINEIWSRLIHLAQQKQSKETSLVTKATFFGERHATSNFASVSNITCSNISSIGKMFASLCMGIIENLHDMFPSDILIRKFGCKRIMATGSALLRNECLKYFLQNKFNTLQITYKHSSGAAIGAARFIKDNLSKF